MKIDIERGIKGLVVHHKPLTEVQLKRLLLIFDEIYLLDPRQNLTFFKEGAICYTYEFLDDRIKILSSDGFQVMKNNSHLEKPTMSKGSLALSSVIHEGSKRKHIIPTEVPLFNGKAYKKSEERLLDKFDSVFCKRYLNVIDPDQGDFNLKNSINLKIAYDNDIGDHYLFDSVFELIDRTEPKPMKNGMIRQGWVELSLPGNVKLFPKTSYNKPYSDSTLDQYNTEGQYFSIVAKVLKRLAICGTHDLIPVFIDRNIYDFYNLKVKKASNTNDDHFIKSWDNIKNKKLTQLCQLLLQTSIAYIPDREIKRIPKAKLIKYKEEKFDKLYSLRQELFSGFNSLYSLEPNSVPDKEIEEYLNKNILPTINKYNNESTNIFIQKFNRIAILGLSGTLTAGLSYVEGLSPLLTSVLTGVTPLLADGFLTLSSKLTDKELNQYKNTFGYFLDLKSNEGKC